MTTSTRVFVAGLLAGATVALMLAVVLILIAKAQPVQHIDAATPSTSTTEWREPPWFPPHTME